MNKITEMVLELQNASGAKAKQTVLEKYKNNEKFRLFLYYALSPDITYRLSEKTLALSEEEEPDGELVLFSDIFECCEFLKGLRGIDDATVRQVKLLLYKYCTEEDKKIYTELLSKTLRLGVTAKSVNKVIPDLILEWEVQQAYPVEKYPLKDGEVFWLTQKLNGVRATFYQGSMVARSGAVFTGLSHITKELAKFPKLVFDGELTLKNKGSLSDNEAFRTATGIINSDAPEKTEICFTVFDIVPLDDFECAKPAVPYSDRRELLDDFAALSKDFEYISVIPVLYHGSDQSKIDELLEQMVREDKEGLMLNKDVPYKRTRHNGILKVKRFYTMDLPIVGCEEGDGRLQGTLGAFVLEYKGNEVRVGSGFTDEQRAEFWKNKDDLVGALCEVKYKELSYDRNTKLESLQFPIFVCIRSDKSEVSYG